MLAVTSCVAASCAGDGSATAAKGGILTAYVRLLDETGVLLPDASGATIHLEGPVGPFHTATDGNGKFAVVGLGKGLYDLTAETIGLRDRPGLCIGARHRSRRDPARCLVLRGAFLHALASDDPGITELEDGIRVSRPVIRGILGPRYAEGTRLWLRLYGATENVASGWLDPVTSLRVFADLSATSAAASIEAP